MHCSKCGAAIVEGVQSCAACGTPVSGAAPVAAQIPVLPQTAPAAQAPIAVPVSTPAATTTMVSVPPEAPKKKMSPVLLVILGIVIGILLVIPVLVILASIVLASLGSARSTSSDAKVMGMLSILRSQAEIYYMGNNDSYAGYCAAQVRSSVDAGLYQYVCNDSEKNWATSAPLNAGVFYCVDGSGIAKKVSKAITTEAQCPTN